MPNGVFHYAARQSLPTDQGEYDFIIDIIREENPLTVADSVEKYYKDAFLDEVYMTESKYDTLVAVLKNKKNIILQALPASVKHSPQTVWHTPSWEKRMKAVLNLCSSIRIIPTRIS